MKVYRCCQYINISWTCFHPIGNYSIHHLIPHIKYLDGPILNVSQNKDPGLNSFCPFTPQTLPDLLTSSSGTLVYYCHVYRGDCYNGPSWPTAAGTVKLCQHLGYFYVLCT